MNLRALTLILLASTSLTLQAHPDDDDDNKKTSSATKQQDEKKEEKEGKGEVILRIFSDFHTGFGHANDQRGFSITRCYIGYEHEISDELSIKGIFDAGKSSDVSDSQRLGYLKNALVKWEHHDLTINGGLIPTIQFKLQEDEWNYRYVMESFQDEYHFGSSADVGISAKYEIADWFSADAIIVNGEGYKKIQIKDGLNYGLGLTLRPLKGLRLRLYAALNECNEQNKSNTYNYAAFMGYKNKILSLNAEYNYMRNSSFTPGIHKHGFSVYGQGILSRLFRIFARYDKLISDLPDGESTILLGAQFRINSYIKIAPNFRLTIPKTTTPNAYYAYVNFSFGL